MYLLFVDESGTHGGSPVFVLGGIAIHENDAHIMQRRLESLVGKYVPAGRNAEDYELHGSELRNAKKPIDQRSDRVNSVWADRPRSERLRLLDEVYGLLTEFRPSKSLLPTTLFSVALDARFMSSAAAVDRERFAYEVLLNKFDVMLKGLRVRGNLPNRGLVIHDRRVVAERDIQHWTAEWRVAAGTIGQLRNLADVPLFADSRASRLLQVADLVSYAVYRRYASQSESAAKDFKTLWPRFHAEENVTHGCVHYTPDYGQGSCQCEPCTERLEDEAINRHAARVERRRRRMRRNLGVLKRTDYADLSPARGDDAASRSGPQRSEDTSSDAPERSEGS